MKIYTNKLNESWIIDRVIQEWKINNHEITSDSIEEADIIWIISNWTWKKIRPKYLKEKKVVASIYHIDFVNFNCLFVCAFAILDPLFCADSFLALN